VGEAGPAHIALLLHLQDKTSFKKKKSYIADKTCHCDCSNGWKNIPTYSLGGDSRLSALPVMGLPGVFSSSVLLVSTISLSSFEITCCCLRGFFLGDAPGIRSPVAEAFSVEAWVVRAAADDRLALGSVGMHALFIYDSSICPHQVTDNTLKTTMIPTWLGGVHCLNLLLDFQI